MRSRRARVPLFVCPILLACLLGSARGQDSAPKPIDDPEAYAVYASVLLTEWPISVGHAKRLVLEAQTAPYPFRCNPSGGLLETTWKPVAESFRAENAASRQVREGFPIGVPYTVVPNVQIEGMFAGGSNDPAFGWTDFFRRYPDPVGYLMMSAVGFDTGKRRAMVYIAHWCGLLCGGGRHYFMEKVDGVWRETGVAGVSMCAWAS